MQTARLPIRRAAISVLIAVMVLCIHGLALAVQNGDLLVADAQQTDGQGIILDINPTTGFQTVVASGGYLVQPAGLCLDPSNDTLIVADYGGVGNVDPNGAILRVNPFTGQQSIISVGGSLDHPTAVSIDGSGNLIVTQQGANQTSGAILRINPTNGQQSMAASGLPLYVPTGIAIDPNGNYLVSNFQSPSEGSGILNINSASGVQSTVSSGGNLHFGPEGIWLDNTQNQSLLVSEFNTQRQAPSVLLDINTATGAQSVISSGNFLTAPTDVTQSPYGVTYVTDQTGGGGQANVVEVNLQTGAQDVISSGEYLESPTSIVVIPEPVSATMVLALSAILVGRRPVKSTNRLP